MSFVKHILLGVLLIGSNAFGGAAVLSSFSHAPERKIANYFSEAVGQAFLKPEMMRTMMSSHYEYLKLRSSDGQWVNSALQNIKIIGVMGMASFVDDKNQIRNEFKALQAIFSEIKHNYFSDQTSFKEVSMGMSGDFQLAIEEGSTMVRIGSSLFS